MATCNLELDNAYGSGQDYTSGVLGIRRHTPGVGTNGYNDGKAQWIPLSNPHVILGTNGFTAPDQGVDFDVLPPGATTWITITIPNAASAKLSDLMPTVIPLPTPSQIIDGAVADAVTNGTATKPALLVAARPGIANAAPMYSYGPSRYFGMGTSSVLQNTRLFKILGSKVHDNRGVPGFTALDMAKYAFGTQQWPHQGTADNEDNYTTGVGTWTFAESAGGIVRIDPFRNDAGFDGITSSGGTAAKARASAKNALDALIRMVRGTSATLNTDPSFTYTGTGWSVLGPVAGTRSTVLKFTTTPGDKVSVVLTDEDLILLGIDDVNAFPGAPFTATLDGAPYTATLTAGGYPTTTSNQFRKTVADPTNPFGPMAVPSTSGTHTLELTHTGTAGQYLFVDCKIKRSTTPRTVLIDKVTYLGAAGYASYVSLYGATGASQATDDIYNAIIDTVVARFPADNSVKSIDHNALGFNPATMLAASDSVHYNDKGDECITNNVVGVVTTMPARSGLVKTT